MQQYFIYTLTDVHGNVRYVGITNDLQRRYKEHLKDESNPDKFIWLNTNAHFMNAIDNANSKAEAEAKETDYIKHFKRYQVLFNKQKKETLQEKVNAAIRAANARIQELEKEGEQQRLKRKNI